MPKLTANRLRKVLSYDRATGIFRRRGGVKAGKVTGTVRSRGPTIICIDNKLYRANRLAWLYVTGKWPKLEIGYINRNTSDTRWVNLAGDDTFAEAGNSAYDQQVRCKGRLDYKIWQVWRLYHSG